MDTWVASTFDQQQIMLLWGLCTNICWSSCFQIFRIYTQSESGNPRSYGNSMFNFLRNHNTIFHSGYIILRSHQFPQRFQFLHILANTYFLCVLIIGWEDLGEWHWNMYNIMYEMSHQSRFDARYWMLGAGALGQPRGMVWRGRREEGSGWGTHVYLWRIHFNIWQNQYNIVKFKNKIKLKIRM